MTTPGRHVLDVILIYYPYCTTCTCTELYSCRYATLGRVLRVMFNYYSPCKLNRMPSSSSIDTLAGHTGSRTGIHYIPCLLCHCEGRRYSHGVGRALWGGVGGVVLWDVDIKPRHHRLPDNTGLYCYYTNI